MLGVRPELRHAAVLDRRDHPAVGLAYPAEGDRLLRHSAERNGVAAARPPEPAVAGRVTAMRRWVRASRVVWRAALPAPGRPRRASCTCCAGACGPCSSTG